MTDTAPTATFFRRGLPRFAPDTKLNAVDTQANCTCTERL